MNPTLIIEQEWLVHEIKRISPSRYANTSTCLLREIWSSNGKKNLLGNHPDAVLGSLMHKIFEKCTKLKGAIDFEKAWSEYEEELTAKYPEVKPLNLTSRGYWPKKALARRSLETFQNNVSQTLINESSYRSELWIESESKKVGGMVDLARIETCEVTLFDFKTGKIFDTDANIKEAYEVQMKLYAALCSESLNTNKQWPKALYLIDVDEQFHEIPYTQKEALELLEKSEKHLDDINESIRISNNPVAYAQVGDHCAFCQFRPACDKYRKEPYAFDYLKDISGQVSGKKEFSNGSMKITFENDVQVWWSKNEGIDSVEGYLTITNCIRDDVNITKYKTTKSSKVFSYDYL